MNAPALYYWVVGIGFTVITLVVVVAAYEIIITLRVVRGLLNNIKNSTDDLKIIQNSVKVGVLTFLSRALSVGKKGGKT